jgi:hypothetical protein
MSRSSGFFSIRVWIVYLILFVIGIPWYWPSGDERIFLGFPLWVVVTIAVSFVISCYTARLFWNHWPSLDEEEGQEVSPDAGVEPLPFGLGGFIFIGCYLLSLIGIGWLGRRASKETSLQDFYLGGRGVGFLVLWLTLFATQYSGNTIIGFTGKSAKIGFAWITAVQFMIAIVISYQLFAPKLHQLAKRHSFITPTDFLNHRFGSRAINLLATAIMVAALGNFFLAQLTAMGRAVEGLTTFDPDLAFAYGVVFLAVIMLVYELLGGFRAVAWTDVIQGTVLAAGFAVLLVLIFQQFGSPEETTRKLLEHSAEKATPPKGMALRQWINFILLFGCAGALYPQAIQRIYAAKSSRALRRGLAAMSFMPLCATLIAILVGVTVAAHLPESLEGAKTDTALTVMLRQVAEGRLVWNGDCRADSRRHSRCDYVDGGLGASLDFQHADEGHIPGLRFTLRISKASHHGRETCFDRSRVFPDRFDDLFKSVGR